MTHKIVHCAIPEELATEMSINTRNARLFEASKLDTKPTLLKNKKTRASFRSRAYNFNTLPHRLTAIKDPKIFNKWIKHFMKNLINFQKPSQKHKTNQKYTNNQTKHPLQTKSQHNIISTQPTKPLINHIKPSIKSSPLTQ